MNTEALSPEIKAAADAHVRRIVGPTILMGDGSYFDYDAPELTTMTIRDYAWGLCTPRFRCQTRLRSNWQRCLYYVVQHVVLMTEYMAADGHSREDCFAGLMHESDEVVFGDPPGPIGRRHLNLRNDRKLWAAGIDAHFGVTCPHPDLIKRYDLRMLATEKRDLMPQGSNDVWPVEQDFSPFDAEIIPWSPEIGVARFLNLYRKFMPANPVRPIEGDRT